LQHPDEVLLDSCGVVENRRFFLVDATGRLLAGVRHGPLVRVRADFDAASQRLSLHFPDGHVVDGEVALGEPTSTDFYGRNVAGHIVDGPWSDALSAFAGRPLQLLRADRPGDGSDVQVATLVSRASVDELGRHADLETSPDARRFRMLLEIDGCTAHEEDTWLDRLLRTGEAVLRVGGPVPRCAVTTQDPETGVPDLDTLRVIRDYREPGPSKTADFGVYADVVEPGRVRVGDAVQLV
jgi:uncharacterized protein